MEYDDVEALISEATKGMPDENKRKVVGQRLTGALQSERDRPSRPKFPEIWQSEPNVMFDPEDPNPEPFNWGQRKWSDEAYQTRLADLMTELACSPKVPVAQIRGIARRALDTAYPSGATGGLESIPLLFRRDRWWTVLLAERVTTGCPPARGLTEEMLRELEVLAANAALLKMWEAFPTDPAE